MSETPVTAETSQPSWVSSHQTIAIILAFLLLSAYVAPVFVISVVAWSTDLFQQDSPWFAWFAAFMNSSESTLNLFHKVLLPILTAISAVAFRGKPSKGVVGLAIFLIIVFVITLNVGVIFDMPRTIDAMKGLADPVDMRLVKAFFTRVEESLMMYFMLLLGLGIADLAPQSSSA